MQIHELNSFSGTPGSGDYLAIDDGNTTKKVPATSLGVNTPMTLAEAQAGSVTDPRVISPSVLHAYGESIKTPESEFVTEEVAVTTSLSIAQNASDNSNYTINKAGYMPLAFAGWRLANGSGSGGSYGIPFGITMISASAGTATVRAGLRAFGGAVTNCTLYISILWKKINQ